MANDFLDSAKKQFEYYKMPGEKTFAQVDDDKLFWQYNDESNSIATIVKHLWGNMLSRWTDFLTSDGEKEWLDRDAEFDNDIAGRKDLLDKLNEGWQCLFNALNSLTNEDLQKEIYISQPGTFGNGGDKPSACTLSLSHRANCFFRKNDLRQ